MSSAERSKRLYVRTAFEGCAVNNPHHLNRRGWGGKVYRCRAVLPPAFIQQLAVAHVANG
jgi:hypothetical protein